MIHDLKRQGCQRRSKMGPPGVCELVPVVHGRDLWAHGDKRGLGGRFSSLVGV